MRSRLVRLLAFTFAAACSATPASRADERTDIATPVVDSLPGRPPAVDLTGTWATGSTNEPTVSRLELHPPCNFGPALWALEQRGDTLRLWRIPESHAQGIAAPHPVSSSVPLEGRVSGVDLVIGTGATRYRLRYDSTSGHLRGTLNGAPFWAVRQDVVRPEGCIPVP